MNQSTNPPCVVKITFQRIQQFLFAVPRLKAMIGANALLGETIRNELVDLAKENGAQSLDWPNGQMNTEHDPLSDRNIDGQYRDNPQELYNSGITSRDGGHFHAVFNNKASAQAFLVQAQALIQGRLPGVRMSAHIQELGKQSELWNQPGAWGEQNPRLPYFQICQDTGDRLANKYRENETPPYVSSLVTQLESKADDFYQDKTTEIIGLLRKAGKLPSLDGEPRIPKDLSELAGADGYIAVIHADGNGMGARRKLYAGSSEPEEGEDLENFIQREATNERFFHAMRVAVRRAVVDALASTFTPDVLEKSYKLPYQLLMLGGDDLLLVTRPEHAFPFIIEYARALKDLQVPYQGEDTRPISIGAGIAIASHKLPFHRLYELAEQLAGSAKKLYRAQGPDNGSQTPPERSVVDWMVSTGSWLEDVEQARKTQDLSKDGRYCISAKPYFILPAEDGDSQDSFCLKTLWEKAEQLVGIYAEDEAQAGDERDKVARSRMKHLLHDVQRTVTAGKDFKEKSDELYTKEGGLPEDIIEGLFPEKSLWHPIDHGWLTQYRDFMELVEIHYLGRKKKAQDAKEFEKEKNNAQ